MWVGDEHQAPAALSPEKTSSCFGRAWKRENLLLPPGFDRRAFQPVDSGCTDYNFPAANKKKGFEFKYIYLLMH